MSKTRSPFQNIAEYLLFVTLALTVRSLPRPTAFALGGALGSLSRYLLPRRVRTAHDNLLKSFPEMPDSEIRENIKKIFRHLGISAVEMLRLDLFRAKNDLERYFSFNGLEHLERAYKMDRGVILLTGHIGFWEVGTFFMPALGYPVDFVAKKMKNPYVDRYFQKMREAAGGKCLDSKRGARRIIKSLAEKRGVAILLDQHIRKREAVVVDFFGRPACTTPIITQIAMKQGVPVVPVYVFRTKANTYDVRIAPPILFDKEPSDQETVIKNTQALSDSIEEAVRQDITQWFWVHRRWRE